MKSSTRTKHSRGCSSFTSFCFVADSGWSVWEIEMTGGPFTDANCGSNCPNYDYSDMIDYYWPALIAGVEAYSGQDKIDYVGYSNGCRTALSSLEKHSSTGISHAGYYFDYSMGEYRYSDLSSSPVENFVGIGCPGAFEGNTASSELISLAGNPALKVLREANISHIPSSYWAKRLYQDCIQSEQPQNNLTVDCAEAIYKVFYGSDEKISLNLLNDYVSWITYDNDTQPGQGLVLNKITLVNGYLIDDSRIPLIDDLNDLLKRMIGLSDYDLDDGIVILNDQIGILNATNTLSEIGYVIPGASHSDLVSISIKGTSEETLKHIKEGIKN